MMYLRQIMSKLCMFKGAWRPPASNPVHSHVGPRPARARSSDTPLLTLWGRPAHCIPNVLWGVCRLPLGLCVCVWQDKHIKWCLFDLFHEFFQTNFNNLGVILFIMTYSISKYISKCLVIYYRRKKVVRSVKIRVF